MLGSDGRSPVIFNTNMQVGKAREPRESKKSMPGEGIKYFTEIGPDYSIERWVIKKSKFFL